MEGHAQNVSCVGFHPELPIILSGSEDGKIVFFRYDFSFRIVFHFNLKFLGTVRIWHANTYRLENTLNYGLERVWTISMMKGSNNVALGYDEGSMIVKVNIHQLFN